MRKMKKNCKVCGAPFVGFPRAFYCAPCGVKVKKENAARKWQNYKKNTLRAGAYRGEYQRRKQREAGAPKMSMRNNAKYWTVVSSPDDRLTGEAIDAGRRFTHGAMQYSNAVGGLVPEMVFKFENRHYTVGADGRLVGYSFARDRK